MGNVSLNVAEVPAGTCPQWIIALFPQLMSLVDANVVGDLTLYNYGNSIPDPADQDKPWFRLDSNGNPDKWFAFNGGSWLSLHPTVPGLIQLWEGDITNVATFDGGEAAAITPTTGPMWERVTALDARFPIGGGTLPSGTAVAVGSTGGEENHQLVIAELPVHTHANNSTNTGVFARQASGGLNASSGSGATYVADPVANTGGDVAHNNLPPYSGIWFLRRTQRRYYRYP